MNPVSVTGDWCWIDSLDGDPLHEDEELHVVWPDGSIERVRVKVKDSYVEDARGDRLLNRKAYFVSEHRGLTTRFYLRGSELKCERVMSDVVPATDEQKERAKAFVERFREEQAKKEPQP